MRGLPSSPGNWKSNDCLLIADDLTGGADAGVQFAKRGLKTLLIPFRGEGRPPCRPTGAGRPGHQHDHPRPSPGGGLRYSVRSPEELRPQTIPDPLQEDRFHPPGQHRFRDRRHPAGNESSPLFPGPVLPGAGPGAGRGDHDGRREAPGAHGDGHGTRHPPYGNPTSASCWQARPPCPSG